MQGSEGVPFINYSWLWHFEQDNGKDYYTTDKVEELM